MTPDRFVGNSKGIIDVSRPQIKMSFSAVLSNSTVCRTNGWGCGLLTVCRIRWAELQVVPQDVKIIPHIELVISGIIIH